MDINPMKRLGHSTLTEVMHDMAKLEHQVKLFLTKAVTFDISPETKNDLDVATCSAGTTYDVTITATADGEILEFIDFTLDVSISDTIADAGTTPTIDDTTPTMEDGVAKVTVTLPAGTYVANETVTVTISDFTAPDGRTISGGTSVLTIQA